MKNHIASLRPTGIPIPYEHILRLYQAWSGFHRCLLAVTKKSRGGRTVVPSEGVIALHEALDELTRAIAAVRFAMLAAHAQTVGEPADGGWIGTMTVGGDGADARLATALTHLGIVTAFPAAQWNQAQASNPGGDHLRWRAGDLIPSEHIEMLKGVGPLIELYAEARGIDLETPSPEQPERPRPLKRAPDGTTQVEGTAGVRMTAAELDPRVAPFLQELWNTILPITVDGQRGWVPETEADQEALSEAAELASNRLGGLARKLLEDDLALAHADVVRATSESDRAAGRARIDAIERQRNIIDWVKRHLDQITARQGYQRLVSWPLLRDLDILLGGDGTEGRLRGLQRSARPAGPVSSETRTLPADRSACEMLTILAKAGGPLTRSQICDRMDAPMAEKSVSRLCPVLRKAGWRLTSKGGPSGGIVLDAEDAKYARATGPTP